MVVSMLSYLLKSSYPKKSELIKLKLINKTT
jgi:hypothetical protein